MNGLAIASILIGVFVIISRGPLVIWPAATREAYGKILATNVRIRVMGLFVAAIGGAVIMTARESDQAAAIFIQVIGWILAFGAVVFIMIFTKFYKLIADAFLQAMDDLMLRLIGIFSLFLAAIFFYLGIAVFI